LAWLGDVLGGLGGAASFRWNYVQARRVTKSHLSQMREIVDVALRYERWPSGAPTGRWEDAWSTNRPVLSGAKRDDAVEDIERAYSLADEFKRGLGPGARDFDATAENPGEDKDFFERYRASLERADRALATARREREKGKTP
jgi:hypothetical protein